VLSSVDLEVYETFYDALRGASWLLCADSRTDPCSCIESNTIQVTCSLVDGVLRITGIVMQDNHLVGYLPNALSSLTALQVLDLSTYSISASVMNAFYNTACVTIPQCAESTLCKFQNTAVNVCSVAATASPTVGLWASDLSSFQAFFDSLQGTLGWSACNTSRTDPCATASNGCPMGSTTDFITCALVNNHVRITQIKLRDARVRGILTESVVTSLSALTLLDLATVGGPSVTNVLFNGNCLQLPQCYSTLTCVFAGTGASVCPETG